MKQSALLFNHDRRESGSENAFLLLLFFGYNSPSVYPRTEFFELSNVVVFVFEKARAVGKFVCARDLLGGRARALARLLVLLGGTAAATGAACGPQASRLLVATGSLSARCDQQCAAVALHEQQCWQGLRPDLRQATGSPPVAGTLSLVL